MNVLHLQGAQNEWHILTNQPLDFNLYWDNCNILSYRTFNKIYRNCA